MQRILFALLLALPLPAVAQSWCANAALNPTEQTICDDRILRELDLELAAAWREAGRPSGQRDWLQGRDACGRDILCIERSYDSRIAALGRAAPITIAQRRPWCGASRLNAAERTICGDDTLSDLDAALEAVYGAARAAARDGAQQRWLADRNACGADVDCIASEYLIRITELGRRLRER